MDKTVRICISPSVNFTAIILDLQFCLILEQHLLFLKQYGRWFRDIYRFVDLTDFLLNKPFLGLMSNILYSNNNTFNVMNFKCSL